MRDTKQHGKKKDGVLIKHFELAVTVDKELGFGRFARVLNLGYFLCRF